MLPIQGQGTLPVSAKIVDKEKQLPAKTYYSRLEGTRICMPDGKVCEFANRTYITTDPVEQAELDAIVKVSQQLLTLELAPAQKSDVVYLKEIGSKSNEEKPAVGTGAFSSLQAPR